ncbi:hypothetical protein [Aestuariimicrobium sp. Y1814]|uniref:hypothetical protein n=1 Tax=Aestuariimicrobium sp. Y1814 TaxID=3418742 RepID=UPI003DA7321F
MVWTSRPRWGTLGAAALVVTLVASGCTSSDEDVTGTPVQMTTQASIPATEAVPTTPDAPATSEAPTTSPATTSAPPATATDQPTTVSTQTTGLTGHSPDPTDGSRTKQYGGVTTYADNSAIRVDPPQPFTPTGGAPGNHVVVTITVINNSPSAAPIDFWWITGLVDGQPVEPVTDSSQGVGMPTGDLAPGQERSFKLAFPKRADQKLTLEVVWRDGYPFTYEP